MDNKRLVIAKTVCIIIIFTVKGLYLELYGPTLIDLRILFNTTYESVSGAVTGRGSGGFVGALIGGVLADRFEDHLEIFVAVPQAFAGVAVALIPFASDVTVLWGLVNITGIAAGMAYIAYTRLMIIMWKGKASFYVQLMSIGYPTGALIGPILAKPFMAVLDFSKSTGERGKTDTYHVIKESRVQYLYLLVAGLAIASAVPFYVFYTVKGLQRPSGYKAVSKGDTDDTYTDPFRTSDKPLMKICSFMTLLIILYFFNIGGGSGVYGVFVRSFSADVFSFSNEESSRLNTLFWVSVIATRIVGTYAASVIHIKTLVTMQASLFLGGSLVVWMLAATSRQALWVCTVIQGVAQATVYASGVAYSNFRMEVTGLCLMLISFSTYAGDLAYIWSAGSLYDQYGALSVLDTIFVSAIFLFFSTVMFRITERFDPTLKRPSSAVA